MEHTTNGQRILLGREALLQRKPVCFFELPSAGGGVWLRLLTGRELRHILCLLDDIPEQYANQELFRALSSEEKMESFDKNAELGSQLIIYSACDENGNGLFSEDDHQAVRQMAPAIFNALASKILELSYLTDASVDELKKTTDAQEHTTSSGIV